MNKERELLIQAIDAYDVCCDENDAYYERLNNAFEEIRNYLICEPESYKPVAYMNIDRGNITTDPYRAECWKGEGKNIEPLYTRPAQERKPMTKEEIDKGCSLDWFYGSFVEGIRSAERHHGIKGEK